MNSTIGQGKVQWNIQSVIEFKLLRNGKRHWVHPRSRPLAKRASAGGAVYASVSEYKPAMFPTPFSGYRGPRAPQVSELWWFWPSRVIAKKNAKNVFPPNAARDNFGAPSRSWRGPKIAPRPSQKLKKNGVGPFPKSTSRIGAPICALMVARKHVFCWKTITFASFQFLERSKKYAQRMPKVIFFKNSYTKTWNSGSRPMAKLELSFART